MVELYKVHPSEEGAWGVVGMEDGGYGPVGSPSPPHVHPVTHKPQIDVP